MEYEGGGADYALVMLCVSSTFGKAAYFSMKAFCSISTDILSIRLLRPIVKHSSVQKNGKDLETVLLREKI